MSLKEYRTLVYLQEKPTASKSLYLKYEPEFSAKRTLSTLDLFRFSALTWNSHKIHYDQHYAKEVEGYENVLVHGPFTTTLMVDFVAKRFSDCTLNSFEYSCVAPVIAGQEMTFSGRLFSEISKNAFSVRVWVTVGDGAIVAKGTAHLKLNARQ